MCVAGLPTPDYGGRVLVTLHQFLIIDVFAMLVVNFEDQNVLQIRFIFYNIQISVVHMYLFENVFIIIKYYIFEEKTSKLTDFGSKMVISRIV